MAKRSKIVNIESRSRHYRLLLYPDNSVHAAVIQNIMSGIPIKDINKWEYIGIKHCGFGDQAEGGTKEHFHIYLVLYVSN